MKIIKNKKSYFVFSLSFLVLVFIFFLLANFIKSNYRETSYDNISQNIQSNTVSISQSSKNKKYSLLGNISSIIDNIENFLGIKNKQNDNDVALQNNEIISSSTIPDLQNEILTPFNSSSSDISSLNDSSDTYLYDLNQSESLNTDITNDQTALSENVDLNQNDSNFDSNNINQDNIVDTTSSTDIISNNLSQNSDIGEVLNNSSTEDLQITTTTINESQSNLSDSEVISAPPSGAPSGGVSVTIPEYIPDYSNDNLDQSSQSSSSIDTSLEDNNSSSTETSNLDNSTNNASSSEETIIDGNSSSTDISDLTDASSSDISNSSTTIDISSSTPPDSSQNESSTLLYNLHSLSPIPTSINGGQMASFNWNTYGLDFVWDPILDASITQSNIIYSIFDLTDQPLDIISNDEKLGSLLIGGQATALWSGTSTQYSYPVSSGGNRHFYILASYNNEIFSYFDQNVYIPEVFQILQPINNVDSHGSWYDDNWYNLGTGFYGTLHSLTLEGYINDPMYFNSNILIQEFLDSNYTQLNKEFVVSGNAPFTNENKKVTINNLNIQFQPNKYYRLLTDQGCQNRSVILKGTDATGTAMWDAFLFGTGIVRNMYTFSPYISWGFQNNFPPLMSPDSPTNLSLFYNFGILRIFWSQSTDVDTDPSLISYEVNISDSENIDEANWKSVSKDLFTLVNIDIYKLHYIFVRAVDDCGNKSLPSMVVWNPPLL